MKEEEEGAKRKREEENEGQGSGGVGAGEEEPEAKKQKGGSSGETGTVAVEGGEEQENVDKELAAAGLDFLEEKEEKKKKEEGEEKKKEGEETSGGMGAGVPALKDMCKKVTDSSEDITVKEKGTEGGVEAEGSGSAEVLEKRGSRELAAAVEEDLGNDSDKNDGVMMEVDDKKITSPNGPGDVAAAPVKKYRDLDSIMNADLSKETVLNGGGKNNSSTTAKGTAIQPKPASGVTQPPPQPAAGAANPPASLPVPPPRRPPPKFVYDEGYVANAKHKPLEPIYYRPHMLLPFLGDNIGDTVKVFVPAKFCTTQNERVKDRQLWGTDYYTDDSDIVAAMAHSGKYILPGKVPELDIQLFIKVHPRMDYYPGSYNRGVKSRHWEEHDRYTFSIERVVRVRMAMLPIRRKPAEVFVREMKKFRLHNQKRNIVNMRRFTGVDCGEHVDEVTVQYNSRNEPVLKYNVSFFADRGISPKTWTSYRLRSKVLFFETTDGRYELSLSSIADDSVPLKDGGGFDAYRLAKVLPGCLYGKKKMLTEGFLPLKADSQCTVLEDKVDWQEIVFTPAGVCIRGKRMEILSFWWLSIQNREVRAREAAAAAKMKKSAMPSSTEGGTATETVNTQDSEFSSEGSDEDML
eukprot:Nk52_evm79s230 gene=Nk52_evmTU79s230